MAVNSNDTAVQICWWCSRTGDYQRWGCHESSSCLKSTSAFGMTLTLSGPEWYGNDIGSFIIFHNEFLIILNFSCTHFKVPYHIDGGQPSYLIIAGLVFTPLSEPLIEYDMFDSLAASLTNKADFFFSDFFFFNVKIFMLIIIYFHSPWYWQRGMWRLHRGKFWIAEDSLLSTLFIIN